MIESLHSYNCVLASLYAFPIESLSKDSFIFIFSKISKLGVFGSKPIDAFRMVIKLWIKRKRPELGIGAS